MTHRREEKNLLKHNLGVQADQEFQGKKSVSKRKNSIYCLYEFTFLKSLKNISPYFWNVCFKTLLKSGFRAT